MFWQRLSTLGRTLTQGTLQLFYPACCMVCERMLSGSDSLPFNTHLVCRQCRGKLHDKKTIRCHRCGFPMGKYANVSKSGCTVCRSASLRFHRLICLGSYDGILRDVVIRMKHRSGEQLADCMGQLWAQLARKDFDRLDIDCVVPIPLHWWRRWKRGYNQSEVLAQALSRELRLPMVHALKRIRYTPSQHHQTPTQRLANVHGAFQTRLPHAILKKRVLLVDDVVTTGSTCGDASRALLKSGAVNVTVASLARAGEQQSVGPLV